MLNTILHVVIATAIALLISQTHSVRAQSLGLTPATMEATVKRGGSYINVFTLSNGTNTRLRVRCSVSDYWYDEQNQRITGRAGTLPHSASLWVQFAPSEIVIEPHSSGTVNAIITIPPGASGGYYTVPIFETEPADVSSPASGTAQANISVRLEGLLLLTTDIATEYSVEVMAGQITAPTSASPLEMGLDVRNRGTSHARVHGVFALLDASGKLAGRGKIAEKRYMPGQRKSYTTTWGGELAPGNYTALITLSYDRAGMAPATLVHEIHFQAVASTTALTLP